MTAISEILWFLSDNFYSIWFKRDHLKKINELMDSGHEVNAMTPISTTQLNFSIQLLSIDTQKSMIPLLKYAE